MKVICLNLGISILGTNRFQWRFHYQKHYSWSLWTSWLGTWIHWWLSSQVTSNSICRSFCSSSLKFKRLIECVRCFQCCRQMLLLQLVLIVDIYQDLKPILAFWPTVPSEMVLLYGRLDFLTVQLIVSMFLMWIQCTPTSYFFTALKSKQQIPSFRWQSFAK